ncbi:unnamed protein product [Malus baccata var. baccata]
MRYLPLKPRLQRLYMSMHTATDMRWHKERRVNDNVMRHPADGEAWKEFDRMYPDFAADPRNCMKKEYMMLTLIMSEDLGKSIDVYLWPLVDELKDLWENGVRTYDKYTGQMFTMRAAVMWTVNDFPATILDIEGKTKDTIETRLDLERTGIRSSLWMQRVGGTLKKCHPFFTDNIVNILCKFEQIFPPAFFTSMIHVMIHLPDEALLARPVNCRWMYPIERYLDVEIAFNRPQRNNDGGVRKEKLSVFTQIARPFGDPVKAQSFTKNDIEVAHWFILNNCEEALPYLEEHEQLMKWEHPSHLYAKKHRDLFPSWFHAHMKKLKELNSPSYDEELYNLARRPLHVELFLGCHVNGIKFLRATCDDKLSTQNSGVHVPGAGDSEDINFYGKLTRVVQLLYKDRCQVILFKCLWFDTNPHNRKSVKRDHGLLSVNSTRHWYDEDPYILATMAKQIFYLDDPKAGNGWKVVQKIKRIGLYDIPELDHDDNDDVADQQLSSSIEIGEETLRDTNIVQEPFDIPGVPEFEISIDLGDLPQYNAPKEANEDEDKWESGNDSSEDSESYYYLDNVFVPLPDDLLVNLSESRSVEEYMFQDNVNVESAFGPALKASLMLMECELLHT